ncbi:uncharacterized protein LOC116301597 [Actinia tenebrosa]|uniref:Uncharacterized protein LOC116301597 n=1 Tax=Actinia tenebrosa TaxID=6105 RepID=A0A6P8IIB3_ACTTE|nr:uncharacterized protein LOC116301597 [Actinia tenebrosa]
MGNEPRKLILHIDVNNTILVGDSKTKLTVLEGVLNEYMTEITWGNVDENGSWIPTEDPISTKPTNLEAQSYYKYAEKKFEMAGRERREFKEHVRRFTLHDVGKRFRPHVEKVKENLKFKGNLSESEFQVLEPLFMKEEDGLYYRIIPSYFKLLNHLLENNRDFAVILRTFGGDGQVALNATKLYTESLHPDIQFPSSKNFSVNLNPGEILPFDKGMLIRTTNGRELSTYEEIYKEFSTSIGVQLYQDSYDWWKKNDFASSAGKPLLVDVKDSSAHHILFDDNIRTWDPWDNIVNLLVKEGRHFKTQHSQEYLDGICMLRTDLFESILNEDYFIEKVSMCEANFNQYLSK